VIASDYLNQINQYNIRQAWPNPERCALLVIDMQQYFLSILSPILDRVLSIIEACRSRNVRTIFTRHGHADVAEDGGMLAKWWGDLIECGSKDWELIKSLIPTHTDRIIDKNRYSVFKGTDLDKSLKSKKIEELIITGVMTNCCCETTARDAFVRDYRVFFVSDATATVNDELHVASLKNLAFGFAHIVSTESLCRYLLKHNL
jgi:isochorismate hydrolase